MSAAWKKVRAGFCDKKKKRTNGPFYILHLQATWCSFLHLFCWTQNSSAAPNRNACVQALLLFSTGSRLLRCNGCYFLHVVRGVRDSCTVWNPVLHRTLGASTFGWRQVCGRFFGVASQPWVQLLYSDATPAFRSCLFITPAYVVRLLCTEKFNYRSAGVLLAQLFRCFSHGRVIAWIFISLQFATFFDVWNIQHTMLAFGMACPHKCASEGHPAWIVSIACRRILLSNASDNASFVDEMEGLTGRLWCFPGHVLAIFMLTALFRKAL